MRFLACCTSAAIPARERVSLTLTHGGVVDDRAVAGKLLLERLEELLRVVLLGEALEGGDGLATVALLDADVNVVGCGIPGEAGRAAGKVSVLEGRKSGTDGDRRTALHLAPIGSDILDNVFVNTFVGKGVKRLVEERGHCGRGRGSTGESEVGRAAEVALVS